MPQIDSLSIRRKRHLCPPQSANFLPDRRAPRLGPRRAAAFVPSLTRPAFEKFGFPTAALLSDWPAIAGTDLASYTAPERLKWPRRPGTPEQSEAQAAATLVLRVDGPRAIELQHRLPQIIERINAYFGYCAVAQIRLYQAPIESPASKRSQPQRISPHADRKGLVNRIEDPRLRTALSRIAAAIGA